MKASRTTLSSIVTQHGLKTWLQIFDSALPIGRGGGTEKKNKTCESKMLVKGVGFLTLAAALTPVCFLALYKALAL